MGLRQVAETLTAKRLGVDKTFYGRVSKLTRIVNAETINHIYKFWALGGTDLESGEIIYCKDLGQTFILISKIPIIIKDKERFISGIVVIASTTCIVQTLISNAPDNFGYSSKTWTDKLTTYCSLMTGAIDINQLEYVALPRGFYQITISRTTELVYKVSKGDRIIINGTKYKVDSIDETRYLDNAYVCHAIEDDRN